MIDINQIHDEILSGLPNERDRLEDALFNLEFYQGCFKRFPVRKPGQSADATRWQRNSLFMHRAVNTLSSYLYKDDVKRELQEHPEASAWLEECYKHNCANAILKQADRFTYVSDVAAIEVQPSPDPECPVKLQLWDASCFAVWTDPDDPCKADAVATIDRYDGQRRLRLWTADEIREYRTAQWSEATKTSGATAYKLVSQGPNPLGVLPFSFVHYALPTTGFWTPGPGTELRQQNDTINKRLTDLFDACRFNLNPILKLSNVREGWRPETPVEPGAIWNLPASLDTAAGESTDPDADYLQSDPSFVSAGWDDLQLSIDHCLEMIGVQPGQIRMTQESVRSGASLVAEQIEPVKYAEGRRQEFAKYEQDLVRLVLTIGSKHLGKEAVAEYQVTATHLTKAAEDPDLTLSWPSLFPKLPGAESDTSDQWMLDNHLVSRTRLVMERFQFTEEQAERYLESVAEDLKREKKLFADLMPEPLVQTNPNDPNVPPNVDPNASKMTDGDDV